jgi:imidazoleglycerol phosphate synthase glutamine amidotransferase subunit HisH
MKMRRIIMGEIKTKPTDLDVDSFLMSVEPAKKRMDSIELKKVFDSVLNEKAILWNNNMVGYGFYHYKSEKSKQEGDWPLIAFSPRKQYIAIYIMPGVGNYKDLLDKLGKHKISSGSCIYINSIKDIDIDILKELISTSVADMKKMYNVD